MAKEREKYSLRHIFSPLSFELTDKLKRGWRVGINEDAGGALSCLVCRFVDLHQPCYYAKVFIVLKVDNDRRPKGSIATVLCLRSY